MRREPLAKGIKGLLLLLTNQVGGLGLAWSSQALSLTSGPSMGDLSLLALGLKGGLITLWQCVQLRIGCQQPCRR